MPMLYTLQNAATTQFRTQQHAHSMKLTHGTFLQPTSLNNSVFWDISVQSRKMSSILPLNILPVRSVGLSSRDVQLSDADTVLQGEPVAPLRQTTHCAVHRLPYSHCAPATTNGMNSLQHTTQGLLHISSNSAFHTCCGVGCIVRGISLTQFADVDLRYTSCSKVFF